MSQNEVLILALGLYYAVIAFWKHILAAVLILVLIGWAWRRMFRWR